MQNTRCNPHPEVTEVGVESGQRRASDVTSGHLDVADMRAVGVLFDAVKGPRVYPARPDLAPRHQRLRPALGVHPLRPLCVAG